VGFQEIWGASRLRL